MTVVAGARLLTRARSSVRVDACPFNQETTTVTSAPACDVTWRHAGGSEGGAGCESCLCVHGTLETGASRPLKQPERASRRNSRRWWTPGCSPPSLDVCTSRITSGPQTLDDARLAPLSIPHRFATSQRAASGVTGGAGRSINTPASAAGLHASGPTEGELQI